MVQVYRTAGMGKRDIWLAPKTILSINHDARSVVIPGKTGKKATVANEDIRLAIPEESLASSVQSAMDEIDNNIDEYLQILNLVDESTITYTNRHQNDPTVPFDADFSVLGAPP